MKMWEIVKGMGEYDFDTEQIFTNGDLGDIFVSEEGELCWIDDGTLVSILVGDNSDWEVV